MSWKLGCLIVSLAAAPAFAAEGGGYATGLELANQCQAGESACLDYVAGAIEANGISQMRRMPTPYCLPSGLTNEAAAKAVAEWIRDNPAQHDSGRIVALTLAMRATYPCPKDRWSVTAGATE